MKPNKTKYVQCLPVPLIFLLGALSSCEPHFYRPKPIEPVLLSGEKQLKINLVADGNMSAVGLAYSPKNHLGIQAGIGTASGGTSSTYSNGRQVIYQKERYFNPYIAAGYYKNISNNMLFEAYTGLGNYSYKNKAVTYIKSIKSINVFLQPSIAVMHENFEVAFTLRLDYLNRYKTEKTDSIISASNQHKYRFLDYTDYFFIQPGFTIRGGLKNVKLQFQISKSYPFNTNYISIYGKSYNLLYPTEIEVDNHVTYGIGITLDVKDIFKEY